MRALGSPYLVAVASVIEIASCSETPLARVSCNHFSNWRIGSGSMVALVRTESCSVMKRNSLAWWCQKPDREGGLLSVQLPSLTLGLLTLFSGAFGFFLFLGPHAGDLLRLGIGEVVIDVGVVDHDTIFQFSDFPIRLVRIASALAGGNTNFIRDVGSFFGHQVCLYSAQEPDITQESNDNKQKGKRNLTRSARTGPASRRFRLVLRLRAINSR